MIAMRDTAFAELGTGAPAFHVDTVTDIPDSILDIVRQQIYDSRDISQPP